MCVCVCSRGLDQLWAAEGWIDRNMTLGHDGMFDLIRRGFVTYSLGSYLISRICIWVLVGFSETVHSVHESKSGFVDSVLTWIH